MPPDRAGALIGRERELAHLTHLVEETHGRGHALVVEGGAGAGKSRLVTEAAAVASAEGFRELWFRTTPDRRTPGPAQLRRALSPAPSGARTERLHPRQRSALVRALGQCHAPTLEPMPTSIAVLSILEEAAREQPLLVVVEDVHWMDPWVTDLVGFVGRRLSRAPILLLVTSRPGAARRLERYKLPGLDVGALGRAECERMLDDLPGALSASTRAWVLRCAAGNPAALLELATAHGGGSTGAAPPPHLSDPVGAFAAAAKRPRAVRGGRGRSATLTRPTPAEEFGDPASLLSAQELNIVQLAATGLTNRQIAERLYLSHRTIGAHLYRAFPKLGVTRRSQLRRAL